MSVFFPLLTSTIAESWKALPSLGPRTPDGHYSIIPPPQNENWIARWQALMNTGNSTASQAWNADRHVNSGAEPPSIPQTPPPRIFTVSDEVQRIVRATRELFDDVDEALFEFFFQRLRFFFHHYLEGASDQAR